MKRVALVLLLLAGCATNPRPKVDADGCWFDGCNRCCPLPGGGYGCTLIACVEGDTP